ncbi:uncharacterized protein LOC124266027 [Haliotis rubra]|uniref:uncharacterized protein LOC124266027 n=1 Tax=Haliotis rubra TaxID=36100 RepID=UPI001EE5B68D|nr:uncharacterized protein LOC124266027 [Haliotis rubra]
MSGSGFCLAETYSEDNMATRDVPDHGGYAARPQDHTLAMPIRSGGGNMMFGPRARLYTHQSVANSEYSDYYGYYEMYAPVTAADIKEVKTLSRSLFKLKIAYVVLTLFIVLSIVAFILMNPSVSPFLHREEPIRSVRLACNILESICGATTSAIKDTRLPTDLNMCHLKNVEQIIKLIPKCKGNTKS